MNFFSVRYSLNKKVVGELEQTIDVIHNCHVWDDPNFIDRFPFKRIEIDPILSTAVLHDKSKITDLINVGGIGFSYGSLIISNKLKRIFDNFNCKGVQFFKTEIIQKKDIIKDYWQTHFSSIPYEFIDFNKTKVFLRDRDENRKVIEKELKINNHNDFLSVNTFLKYPKVLRLENIFLKPEMNLDYFLIIHFGGSNLGIVSARLKNEIERQNCSGIEFTPVQITIS